MGFKVRPQGTSGSGLQGTSSAGFPGKDDRRVLCIGKESTLGGDMLRYPHDRFWVPEMDDIFSFLRVVT